MSARHSTESKVKVTCSWPPALVSSARSAYIASTHAPSFEAWVEDAITTYLALGEAERARLTARHAPPLGAHRVTVRLTAVVLDELDEHVRRSARSRSATVAAATAIAVATATVGGTLPAVETLPRRQPRPRR